VLRGLLSNSGFWGYLEMRKKGGQGISRTYQRDTYHRTP